MTNQEYKLLQHPGANGDMRISLDFTIPLQVTFSESELTVMLGWGNSYKGKWSMADESLYVKIRKIFRDQIK